MRRGFTIIELMVSIAIIGILLSLLLPAIQMTREAARQTQCRSNLRQLGLAIHNYEGAHSMLPPGSSMNYSLHTFLLPFLDQAALYETVDFRSHPARDTTIRRDVMTTPLEIFKCPSESGAGESGVAFSNYFANYGTGVQKSGFNGVYRYLAPSSQTRVQGPVRVADITDGLSTTASMAEGLAGLGYPSRHRSAWHLPSMRSAPAELEQFAAECFELSSATSSDNSTRGTPWATGQIHHTGYTHINPPNSPNCLNGDLVQEGSYAAGSMHSRGINLLLADGHVRSVSELIDRREWRSLGSRDGSE